MAPLTSVARKSMRSVATAWAYPVTEPTAWMWVMLNEPCWYVLVDTGRAPPSGTAPPLTTTVRVLKKYWVLLTFRSNGLDVGHVERALLVRAGGHRPGAAVGHRATADNHGAGVEKVLGAVDLLGGDRPAPGRETPLVLHQGGVDELGHERAGTSRGQRLADL